MDKARSGHEIPVNVYEEGERIMVAAPIPGLEPQDLRIEVKGQSLSIHADMRGPGQERNRHHLHEWTVGPYHRTVQLPAPIDPARANASYDNGILVLVLPRATTPTSGQITVSKVGTSKGQTIGHHGHDLSDDSAGRHM